MYWCEWFFRYLNHVHNRSPSVFAHPSVATRLLSNGRGLRTGGSLVTVIEIIRRHDAFESIIVTEHHSRCHFVQVIFLMGEYLTSSTVTSLIIVVVDENQCVNAIAQTLWRAIKSDKWQLFQSSSVRSQDLSRQPRKKPRVWFLFGSPVLAFDLFGIHWLHLVFVKLSVNFILSWDNRVIIGLKVIFLVKGYPCSLPRLHLLCKAYVCSWFLKLKVEQKDYFLYCQSNVLKLLLMHLGLHAIH